MFQQMESNFCMLKTMLVFPFKLFSSLILYSLNKAELCNYQIRHITSVCQDQEDLIYFALITKTDPNLYHYCHVFTSPTTEHANELILTIGQSFELAYKIFCQKSFNN